MSGDDRDDDDEDKRRATLAIDDDAVEALRRATLYNRELKRDLDGLRARHSVLVDILTANGTLQPGHIKLMDSEAADAASANERRKVRLKVLPDGPIESATMDCEARLHLCQARCCSLNVILSEQDLENGLAWEIDEPYMMRREVDGYCTYLDRSNGRCGAYDRRPADCRIYHCRDDPRIWANFEERIPSQPMSGIRPIKLKAPP